MFCCKCGNDLKDCTCEDIKERLASLKNSPYILMRWCARCDNHYSQCECNDPVWTTNAEMEKLKNQTCPHCGKDELGYDQGRLRCLCCKKFIN